MYLTQNNVIEALYKFNPKLHMQDCKSFRLDSIQFLVPGMEYKSNIIYLGTWVDLPTIPEDVFKEIFIICMGSENDVKKYIEDYQGNFVLISPNISLHMVGNELSMILAQCLGWRSLIYSAIIAQKSPGELFEITKGLFDNNPVILVDSSFNIIASTHTEYPENPDLNHLLQDGFISKDITDAYARLGLHKLDQKARTPFFRDVPTFVNCAFSILPMHYHNDSYAGFLAIYYASGKPQPTMLDKFTWFSKVFSDYYISSSSDFHENFDTAGKYFADLVEHKNDKDSYLIDRALSIGLTDTDTYRMCVVHPVDENSMTTGYVASILKRRLSDKYCFVFPYNGCAVVLIKSTFEKAEYDNVRACVKHVSDIALEFGNKVSFSTSHMTVLNFDVAYKQTLSAYKYGGIVDPDKQEYFYSEYYIYEMIDHYSEIFPIESMYQKRLMRLRKNNSNEFDYFHLLYLFLATERNVSETANLVHMHRNSVNYRIEKLCDTLNLNLDNPQIRFRTMFSLYVIKYIDALEKTKESANCVDVKTQITKEP